MTAIAPVGGQEIAAMVEGAPNQGAPMRNLAHGATRVIETEPALRPDVDPSWAGRPGTGNCTRTDGATGPIETLIPDGWVLRDLGLTIRTTSGNSQVYVLLDPTRASTALDHVGYVDWVVEEGSLLLALVEGDPPVSGRERLSTLVFHDDD